MKSENIIRWKSLRRIGILELKKKKTSYRRTKKNNKGKKDCLVRVASKPNIKCKFTAIKKSKRRDHRKGLKMIWKSALFRRIWKVPKQPETKATINGLRKDCLKRVRKHNRSFNKFKRRWNLRLSQM